MPTRRTLEIKQFRGLFSGADPADLSLGHAANCQHLDPTSAGLFRGLPESVSYSVGATAVGAVLFRDGDAAVAATDAGGVIVLENLRGSPTSVAVGGSVATYGGGCSDSRAVRLAAGRALAPVWVGDGGAGGYDVQEAVLRNFADDTGGGLLQNFFTWTKQNEQVDGPIAGGTYVYAYSIVYDDFQETPLVRPRPSPGLDNTGVYIKPARLPTDRLPGSLKIEIVVATAAAQDNPRITGIKFYRAYTQAYVGGGRDNIGVFTLIKEFGRSEIAQGATLSFEDRFEQGPTFEDEAGYTQSLPHSNVYYGLSERMDEYHFIADVNVVGLDGADSDAYEGSVMRSILGRFDQFDWARDYVPLPTKPKALKAFDNLLWCFDTGRTYVLSSALGDVRTIEGVGCEGPTAVLVTDEGMFVAGTDNLYFHDHAQLRPIGDGFVVDNYLFPGTSYRQRDRSRPPVVLYDAEHALFVVVYQTEGVTLGKVPEEGSNVYLAWHPRTGRWTRGALTAARPTGGFMGADGRAWLSIGVDMLDTFGGTERLAPAFWSGNLAPGTGQSVFYEVAVWGDRPTDDSRYVEDGSENLLIFESNAEGTYHRATCNSSPRTGTGTRYKRVWDFRLVLRWNAGEEGRRLTVYYRPLVPRAEVTA